MLITDHQVWLGDGTIRGEILAWLEAYGETNLLALAIMCDSRQRPVGAELRKLEHAGRVECHHSTPDNPAHHRWQLTTVH